MKPLPFVEYSLLFPERTERLHVMPVNCGHVKTSDRRYSWDGLKRGGRELVIWQYTISGMGAARFGERVLPVAPGSAFLGIVPEDHCYYLPPESESWEFLYVSVHGSEAVRLASEFRRKHGVVHEFAAGSPTVETACGFLLACHERPMTDRYAASAWAYRLLMALLAEPAGDARGADEEFLRRVHRYCMAHLDSPIQVAELAKACRCSRSHFTRRFRQAEGCAPHEFIDELRMRLAMRLLQTTNGTIKEVASACGYDDASYFCKVFKKIHGTTPAGFRTPGAARPSQHEDSK